MEVLVVGVAFSDITAEAVDAEVHIGEADGVAGLLLTVDRQLLAGVAAVTLHEVGRLREHAAGAARGVVDLAVEGFEDLHDEPHDRGGGEELAALLAFGEGELAEEVLVDEPEPVALDRSRQRPQEPHQLAEDVSGNAGIVLRQHAPEIRVVDLDAAHGLVQGLADVGILGQVEQRLEPGLLGQVQRAYSLVVVGPDRTSSRARAHGLGGLGEPLVGIPQEDEPQHGRGVLRRLQPRVGPKLVCRLPKPAL